MGAFTAHEGRFHCLHPSACCRERVWAGTFSFTSWTWFFDLDKLLRAWSRMGNTVSCLRGESRARRFSLSSPRQVYKGPETSFRLPNLQTNCEYRLRVCAGRQSQDASGSQELYGPYSPSTVFSSQKRELVPPCADSTTELAETKKTLREERFIAIVLLCGFAVVAILFAVVIQYFVIK